MCYFYLFLFVILGFFYLLLYFLFYYLVLFVFVYYGVVFHFILSYLFIYIFGQRSPTLPIYQTSS